MTKYTITVLDFTMGEAFIYKNIELNSISDTTVEEWLIENTGHNLDNCQWMIVGSHLFNVNVKAPTPNGMAEYSYSNSEI